MSKGLCQCASQLRSGEVVWLVKIVSVCFVGDAAIFVSVAVAVGGAVAVGLWVLLLLLLLLLFIRGCL